MRGRYKAAGRCGIGVRGVGGVAEARARSAYLESGVDLDRAPGIEDQDGEDAVEP